jgi:methylmalonyl-CoA/ethylmalonyl-CoA epimerase
MLSKIHHIGIVVHDADEAMRFYRDALGLAVSTDREIRDQGVRGVLLPIGQSELELLQPTREDTGIARYLAARGEGMHHVCFETDDCVRELNDAAEKGIELIDREPREGLAGMIGFLHPKSNHGVLVEFAQPPAGHHAAGPDGLFRKIDHVAVVVKDLDAGLATFEGNFGLRRAPNRGGDVPALGIRNAFLPIGESDIELLVPTTDVGPVAKFASERGEGTFLLSLAVSDVGQAVEHLRSLGARAGDPSPGGVAFVSMKSTHGVNLQLVQR